MIWHNCYIDNLIYYGKVLKITETTDGKILLIETGEDKKVSYMNIHINAVYGIDEKEGNNIATEQAMLALCSMIKMRDGKRLYDFR